MQITMLDCSAGTLLLTAASWPHLCVVVRDLAEQVVGHVRVSDAVEEDVQDAVAAAAGGDTQKHTKCTSSVSWQEHRCLWMTCQAF
jgi:hypothetical protein